MFIITGEKLICIMVAIFIVGILYTLRYEGVTLNFLKSLCDEKIFKLLPRPVISFLSIFKSIMLILLKERVYQYIITIIAGFIVLVCSITFTNASKDIQIIEAASQEAKLRKHFLGSILEIAEEDEEKFMQLISDNIMPYPTLVQDILKNSSIINIISQDSYHKISTENFNLGLHVRAFEEADEIKLKKYYLKSIVAKIDLIGELMDLEIKHMKSRIELSELRKEHERLDDEQMELYEALTIS